MTIKHHPSEATLMSYAAGSLAEPLAAVVAAHLKYCPACRETVRNMEQIGAGLFSTLAPTPILGPSPHPTERAVAEPRSGLKTEIKSAIESDLDAIDWKWLGFGFWQKPLALSGRAKGALRLVKVAPGQAIPEHGHAGAELTLVLRGSYSDETGRYGPGDVADLDEDIEHRPVADDETPCICLLASEKLTRFKGVLPRLLQPFTGI